MAHNDPELKAMVDAGFHIVQKYNKIGKTKFSGWYIARNDNNVIVSHHYDHKKEAIEAIPDLCDYFLGKRNSYA